MSTFDEGTLIAFKTGAWKSAAMVENYAAYMHSAIRTNGLKNRSELELIRRAVTGRDVLDVGVGTGRAALPLARAGWTVTGLDVSQAMLDQTRAEAGDVQLSLVQGDIAALPFPDETYSTVVSLNCLMHFPNWKTILAEWARVVRRGGRLIFDMHSMDHILAVADFTKADPAELLGAERDDPGRFVARVTSRELLEQSAAIGLTIHSITPYAAILGGGNSNFWLWKSVASGPFYERLLSWIGVDRQLAELAYFLEQAVGAFTSAATGRFMAVLVKGADSGRMQRYAVRTQAISQALSAGNLETVATAVGVHPGVWQSQLEAHLSYAKNVTFLAIVCAAIPDDFWSRCIRDVIPPQHVAEFERVRRGFSFDALTANFLRKIRADELSPSAATYRGVDIASILRYEIGRRAVTTFWERERSI